MTSVSHSESTPSAGRLLAILIACFYALFTLLPDSHSLMVKWSWVFIWQVGLLCPVILLLVIFAQTKRLKKLGLGLDWGMGLIIIGIIISSLFAEFSSQARWYGWVSFCFVAALYILKNWINSQKGWNKLLIFQGYLNLGFIVISLILWTTQTLLPELSRLNTFKRLGVNLTFDFSNIELRNWAPIGHQNYVAGYLLLALPLLVGLAIKYTGKQRIIWIIGIVLGLLDLYTTSSRGGWLGLFALFVVGFIILIWHKTTARLWLGIGGIGGLLLLLIIALVNNRIRTLWMAVFQGKGGGEFAYRLINTAIGWSMGSSHPLTGIGLGGVPLLYQKYRPIWAGRESELAYQLHSTPVQLWAEMGIFGIVPILLITILLSYYSWQWLSKNKDLETPKNTIFFWSIWGALFAYLVMSSTDYQLDNISISGTLVIYLAYLNFVLTDKQEHHFSFFKIPAYGVLYSSLGIVLVMIIWLIPIHRAWQLSSQSFTALNQQKLELFVKWLGRSHELVPWEPYYPYQLGWNLGNIGLQVPSPQQRQLLINDSVKWLEKGIKVSPYNEFGYTNLGWLKLQLQGNFLAATKAFSQSVKLVPAKRGIMYGLGLSLLAQNKPQLALDSFILECLRDPLFMTSPLWRSPNLQLIYPQVLQGMISRYTELLEKYSEAGEFNTLLHQSRGGIYWWEGNFKAAEKDLKNYGTILSKALLSLSQNQPIPDNIGQPASDVIEAWKNPSKRNDLLQKAWILGTQTEFSAELQQELIKTMEKSENFYEWVKDNAPMLKYRRERTGFGVVSRHLDGSIPSDFWLVVDNLPMNTWFSDMLPSPVQNPELDLVLQPFRDILLKQLESL
ncbi:O-antigen ligase family protein [Aphanothece sacrum]|uniref:O-antigen polymerase n=1 Tax=Aphanothece sacrum FPU1 TaxID=1920663 RepID=A0A401IFH2_APHSA|nr:O-antigen ligase family protein [Aphanothece sacrum]GBF80047.1 O-antigen polymerase [Aphanothece sacrum FPU1]GBF84590.1 O-antigen polymerase [Aphanothece sacrum FPU3]